MGEHSEALLLIASVRAARLNGVKHFTEEGVLLDTDDAIIEALTEYGSVITDDRERVQRVAVDDIYFALRRAYGVSG